MYKKIAIVTSLALGMAGFAYAGTMPVVYPQYNTVSFTLKDKTTIKSDTALVQITVNATALSDNQKAMENTALQTLKTALPMVQWQVVNYHQTQAQSGAMNVQIEIQGRLTQTQIQILNKTLEGRRSPNQKLTVQVLNFNPTVGSVSHAKMNLMIEMYNKIQNYLKKFNQQTHRSYHIQTISYNDNNALAQRVPSPMVQMASADGQDNLSVSQDVKLSAYVTFAQKA